jgi:hypothetical protein
MERLLKERKINIIMKRKLNFNKKRKLNFMEDVNVVEIKMIIYLNIVFKMIKSMGNLALTINLIKLKNKGSMKMINFKEAIKNIIILGKSTK